MTETHPASTHPATEGSALAFYVLAAIIVLGAALGILTMGLGGMILWMVGLTFVILAGLVIVPFR